MNSNEEFYSVLDEFNYILSEERLDKRINNEYSNKQAYKLADNINRLLDMCERVVTEAINTESRYRDMKAELQSDIRNPLSCIKSSCFLAKILYNDSPNQSEKFKTYIQIIERAVEDIERALK